MANPGLGGISKGNWDLDLLEIPLGLRQIRGPRTLPVTDPALWLDAADDSTLTIATGVSSWANKGTAGGAASQGTTAAQPTPYAQRLGRRFALYFDGVDDRLDMTYANYDPTSTWFYAARFLAGSCVIGTQGNNGYQQVIDGTNGFRLIDRFAGTSDATIPTVIGPAGGGFVIGVRLDSTTLQTVYAKMNAREGTVAYTGSASAAGNLAIMYNHISGLIVQEGLVGEILHYSYPMGDSDFVNVGAYLAQKWGISGW